MIYVFISKLTVTLKAESGKRKAEGGCIEGSCSEYAMLASALPLYSKQRAATLKAVAANAGFGDAFENDAI